MTRFSTSNTVTLVGGKFANTYTERLYLKQRLDSGLNFDTSTDVRKIWARTVHYVLTLECRVFVDSRRIGWNKREEGIRGTHY